MSTGPDLTEALSAEYITEREREAEENGGGDGGTVDRTER